MRKLWQKCRLGDLIDIKHGFAFKGEHFQEEPTGFVLVTPGNFRIGGGFQKKKLKYYDGPIDKDYVLSPGDLLVTMTDLSKTADTLGYSALVPNDENTYLHNQRIGLVQPKSEEVREDFLSYLMRAPGYRAQVLATATGSTVKHTSPKRIYEYSFELPPKEEQKRIASTLRSLDDKIEHNRQTARTLEELAQRLFKSWFVDFDPVRAKMAGRQPAHTPPEIADLFPDRLVESPLGPIPEGWEFRPLADFADFVNGKNFTKNASGDGRMVIRIAELNSGPGARTVWNEVDADDKYVAEPGSILFAWSGSLGVYRWYRDSAIINQHIFKVIPHDGISKAFCFQAVQHLIEEFRQIAASKAVTMGHIKRSDLKEHGLHVPPDFRLVAAFSKIASPLWERALLLEQECETLAQLRDRLLPKLISGEIQVPASTPELEDAL